MAWTSLIKLVEDNYEDFKKLDNKKQEQFLDDMFGVEDNSEDCKLSAEASRLLDGIIKNANSKA